MGTTVEIPTKSSGGGSIGDAITGGTAGRVLFEGAGPVLADDAGLTYDPVGDALTIGTRIVTSFAQANSGIVADIIFNLAASTLYIQQNNGIRLTGATPSLVWGDASPASTDMVLTKDASNTLAQRNGVNAQTFNVYNTFTDASNYERGAASWSANTFTISTSAAGTGTGRGINISPVAGWAHITGQASTPTSTGGGTTSAGAILTTIDTQDFGAVLGFGTTSRLGGGSYYYGGIGGFRGSAAADYTGYVSIIAVKADSSSAEAIRCDIPTTAGYTSLVVFDVDSGVMQRVKVGAAGTGPGGSGRALYIA